jgi:hypothetical protein
MMPPANRPVSELSEETGISAVTLYAWRKRARAARAVVIRDVPPACFVAGYPARIVRRGVTGCNDVGVQGRRTWKYWFIRSTGEWAVPRACCSTWPATSRATTMYA